jgi:hypothetical protein
VKKIIPARDFACKENARDMLIALKTIERWTKQGGFREMIYCRLDFNNLYDHGRIARFQVSGVGQFPVFSGIGAYVNRPECSMLSNAAIPPGKYWIVDRPKGGALSTLQQWGKELATGNSYDDWFGLFRQDGVIDDRMQFNVGPGYYYRSSFRLHSLRPDGTGLSEGCITFCHRADFYAVRAALLHTHKMPVQGGNGLMAYGEVTVTGNTGRNCNVSNR